MKKYNCTAHIRYDFCMEADSPDEANLEAYMMLADDIAKGIIPIDALESPEGLPPLLVDVDVKDA